MIEILLPIIFFKYQLIHSHGQATRLMGLDTIGRWEEPQTVRYQSKEKFTWHLDALAPSETLNDTGGQRVATLLVYLTDIGENNGGSTAFRDLGDENNKYLKVQPKINLNWRY